MKPFGWYDVAHAASASASASIDKNMLSNRTWIPYKKLNFNHHWRMIRRSLPLTWHFVDHAAFTFRHEWRANQNMVDAHTVIAKERLPSIAKIVKPCAALWRVRLSALLNPQRFVQTQ